jgi:hypothetical protein
MTGCGHDDCQRISSYPTSCLHASRAPVTVGAVAFAAAFAHRHRWVFDGALIGGMLVYHCDDHDPPVVRQVWPGATK